MANVDVAKTAMNQAETSMMDLVGDHSQIINRYLNRSLWSVATRVLTRYLPSESGMLLSVIANKRRFGRTYKLSGQLLSEVLMLIKGLILVKKACDSDICFDFYIELAFQ